MTDPKPSAADPAAASSPDPAASASSPAPAASASSPDPAASASSPDPAVSASSQAPRMSSRFARLRSAFGVPRYSLDEVNALGQHILVRLYSLPARDANETEALKRQRLQDWVLENFTRSLRTLLLQSSRNGRGNVILNLVVIGGGFATSG